MKHFAHHITALCLVSCAIGAALSSCSTIDEADRLKVVDVKVVADDIPEEPVETDSLYDAPVAVVERRILIEDHTGQKCPNCPDATRLAHNLQRQYPGRIIPVAIHSQMQGIMEPEGLGNELGNSYYQMFKIEYKPAGLINRIDGGDGVVLDKTIWELAVKYIADDTTPDPLDIRVKAQVKADDPTKADIDVKVIATLDDSGVAGKLQVWLTEDNIVAPQDSLSGARINDYVHNHVLRATANGLTGEDVSVNGFGDQKEFHYTVDLSAAWKPKDLAIVAFVYNDSGVVQVVRRSIRIDD